MGNLTVVNPTNDKMIDLKNEAARARQERRDQERRQIEELRTRLECEHGLEKHPKRDLLWSKAWEHGHACGLPEVEIWYSDLAELVK